MCECPSPMVLDGEKCVGMLWFDKENLHTVLYALPLAPFNCCPFRNQAKNLVSFVFVWQFHCQKYSFWCISMANILLLECVKATDCPYGGINYQCVDNLCKCPSTMELVDKMCKGISTHI